MAALAKHPLMTTWLALFSIAAPLAALLPGCGSGPAPAVTRNATPRKALVLITPHNEMIRYAFEVGFASWYLEHKGAVVNIEWIFRGTPDCVAYVERVPGLVARREPIPRPDVMFGGGIADHARLADGGLSTPLDLDDVIAAYPTDVNGIPTRDPKNRWFATGLSSFGLLINAAACAAREIPAPATWADLAEPRFASWLAIADPRFSGSHRECLALTLEQLGWEQGWPVIMRMLANTRALSGRSGAALDLTISGHTLATFAVNFDGAARAAGSGGPARYLIPSGATAVTPDVISALQVGEHPDVAADFVRFVLSEEGQALWAVSSEERNTPGESLYHYPIDPAIYEKYAGALCVDLNPFADPPGLTINAERARTRGVLLEVLIPAAAGDNHIELQRLWERVRAAGSPTDLVTELLAPPFDDAQALAHGARLAAATTDEEAALLAEWSQMFTERYARVARALAE